MDYQQSYQRSIQHPEQFWGELADRLSWFQKPQQILSQDEEGLYRWFAGGRLNTCFLALDYHVEQGRGEQVALIYDSPVTGRQQTYTYCQLRDLVAGFAGALQQQGVGRGDTVIIYMPMIPQTVIAMLACARLGAIHSVVFGGFAPHELAIRIDDAQPKLLLTASAGKEVDREIDYMRIVSAALEESSHQPERCIVYQRSFRSAPLQPGRDLDWESLADQASPAECVEVEATDPLYILYTSGTTGRPKGVVRDNGGHAVALKYSMSAIYGAEPGEVFWAASDVGWVVGHSYIVYAPLLHGCATVLYEGKPVRTPDAGAFWRVVSEHGVRVLFTAPTAIRAIKREDPGGELAKAYDLSGLRYLFLAGERCDVATLEWSQRLLDVPVIDHWWQTESGWPMLANMAGLELLPIKPGSACKPVCGYDIRILDTAGRELPAHEEGDVVARLPLPPGCLPNLWRNTERFREAYLNRFPGYYLTGDGGYKDDDGYVYITGRVDDVINVAGHRLSTATMEELVAAHPAVAECAVVGVADELKGQIPIAFVTLQSRPGIDRAAVAREIVRSVRENLGAVASLKQVVVTRNLPKTRSGKILRRIMRRMANGEPFKTPPTIENAAVIDELAQTMRDQKLGQHQN